MIHVDGNDNDDDGVDNDYKDGVENASHFIKMTIILKMILLLVSNDNNNHHHDCMGCRS